MNTERRCERSCRRFLCGVLLAGDVGAPTREARGSGKEAKRGKDAGGNDVPARHGEAEEIEGGLVAHWDDDFVVYAFQVEGIDINRTSTPSWRREDAPFNTAMITRDDDANDEGEADHNVERDDEAALGNEFPKGEAGNGHRDDRPVDFSLSEAKRAGQHAANPLEAMRNGQHSCRKNDRSDWPVRALQEEVEAFHLSYLSLRTYVSAMRRTVTTRQESQRRTRRR